VNLHGAVRRTHGGALSYSPVRIAGSVGTQSRMRLTERLKRYDTTVITGRPQPVNELALIGSDIEDKVNPLLVKKCPERPFVRVGARVTENFIATPLC
jgi:hypothetical protein